jgi:hypothetical protein
MVATPVATGREFQHVANQTLGRNVLISTRHMAAANAAAERVGGPSGRTGRPGDGPRLRAIFDNSVDREVNP